MKLDTNQASIHEAIDAGLLAGAVTLVWRSGEVLQVNELGYRDVQANLPMQRDTIFRIASMSKPVTVAAAMTLVDEGRLTLTDPVAKWLPELSDMRVLDTPGGPLEKTHPARRPLTVDDLMTHRSGLAYFFSVTGPLAKAYSRISARIPLDGAAIRGYNVARVTSTMRRLYGRNLSPFRPFAIWTFAIWTFRPSALSPSCPY